MGKKVCAKVLETTSVKFPSHSVSRWRDPWCWSRWMCFSLYIILCLKQNTLVFRSWGSLRFFMFLNEISFINAHQGCICLIKKVKPVILWKSIHLQCHMILQKSC